MISWRIAALAAAVVAFGPCDQRTPMLGAEGQIEGTWGGNNAALIVDDTSTHVHIGCTNGRIPEILHPDAEGRFDVLGQHNITAHPVDLGIQHPARFIGRIVGSEITLTVRLTDTSVVLGPVLVVFGKEPKMGPCPICQGDAIRK